jgi:hypothetical protein
MGIPYVKTHHLKSHKIDAMLLEAIFETGRALMESHVQK